MLKVRAGLLKTIVTGSVFVAPWVFADSTQSAPGYGAYQSAQVSQRSAGVITPEDQKAIDDAAFKALIKEYFPLSREEVHAFKDASAEQKKTNAMPPGPAPAVETSNIIPVDFKPGHVMPVIRIAAGSVSSIVFTDKAGKVWPIVSYTIGDPDAFGIQWNKSSGVLMLQGKKMFGQSNIGVILQGMEIPVMITILLGQDNWDYLDYIQVQQYMPSDQGLDTSINATPAPPYLISVLNGVPPAGAVELKISDSSAKVWTYLGKYLMLTQSTLLSPSWSFRADGPNGYHAYEIQPTPYLMLSNQGKIEKLVVTSTSDGNASSTPGVALTQSSGGTP